MSPKEQKQFVQLLVAMRTAMGGFAIFFLIIWLYYGNVLGAPLGLILLCAASAMVTLRL